MWIRKKPCVSGDKAGNIINNFYTIITQKAEFCNEQKMEENYDCLSIFGNDNFELSEEGLLKLFCKRYSEVAKYDNKTDTWYVYNEKLGIWEIGKSVLLKRFVREMIDDLWETNNGNEEAMKFLLKYRNYRGVDNFSKYISVEEKFDIDAEKFDGIETDSILNTPSCMINLETGEKLEKKPENFITRITNCDILWDRLHDTTLAPNFKQLLWYAQPNEEIRNFVLDEIGSRFFGANGQELFVIHGVEGGTGKSTIFNAIIGVLGNYGYSISTKVIVKSTLSDIAKLSAIKNIQKARFVQASETPAGAIIDDEIVKKFTDKNHDVKSYYKGMENVRRIPSVSVDTNHNPIIRVIDGGLKRRVKTVKWEKQIKDAPFVKECVGNYADFLIETEGDEILTFIVSWILERGITKNNKIHIPEQVDKWTQEYFEDMDLILQFFKEEGYEVTKDENDKILLKDLRYRYNYWTDFAKLTTATMKQHLYNLGIKVKTGTGNQLYVYGVRKS